jgi:iron complex outermembrane receptor protein
MRIRLSRRPSPSWIRPLEATRLAYNDSPATYQEYAGFANLTIHATDRFDVQIGGRESRNEQTQDGVTISGSGVLTVAQRLETQDSSFTYLVTPRLKLSPDLMLYARLASGYRAGGPNTVLPGIARQFDPDETRNYEIGIKGDFLARTFSIDASLYRIDWQDLQLNLRQPINGIAFSYRGNGSEARSQGAELSMEWRPMPGMTLASWVSWNDAELTEDLPATSTVRGLAGDRLPYSSRFSGNLSLDQEIAVGSSAVAFFGASVSYVGNRKGAFLGTTQRDEYAAYARTDVHAGMTYDNWTADVFVNNVTDKRGVVWGGLSATPPNTFYYIQPRTIGLSLTRTF